MSRRSGKPSKQVASQNGPKQNASAHLEVRTESSFSGPIPPPETLFQYDSIEPGLAGRIMAMAERESLHRHDIEKGVLQANGRTAFLSSVSELLGQVFGFLIGVLTLAAGTYLAATGKEGVGGLVGTAGVVGLVAVFVYGRRDARTKGEKQGGSS